MKVTLTGSALVYTSCVLLCSCEPSKQRFDYNWLSDSMLAAQEDQVNVEAGEGLQAPLPATAPATAVTAPAATPQPAPAAAPAPAPAAPKTAAPEPKKPGLFSQLQPAPRATAPAHTGLSGTYMVQKGDTLSVIARRHGVSLAAIVQANNLSNPNALRIGQVLTIPGKGAPAPQAPAQQAQQPAPQVAPMPAAAPQAPAAPASAATHTYTVQSGDTLSRIARRYNTTIPKIMQANGMTPEQANRLSIGQRILLPSH